MTDLTTAKRLAARAKGIQRLIQQAGFAKPTVPPMANSPEALLNARSLHAEIQSASRKLFLDGHYPRAVEEGFKALNNFVKEKSGLQEDGASLMQKAFTPNNPKLKLNDLRSDSKKNEQQGYMEIYAGSMTGIRNPRAHEHRLEDDPLTALDLLSLASHLYSKAENATRTRRRRKA